MIYTEGEKLIYKFDAEQLVIEAWGKDSLRVRAIKQKDLPAEDWALLETPEKSSPTIEIQENCAYIQNGKIKARIGKSGKVVFTNEKGKVLLEEFIRTWKYYFDENGNIPRGLTHALNIVPREFRPILGGDYSLAVRFESNPEEKIYGMGQYQQPFLNLKGCTLELAHRNSQASVPFAISNLGYGFLWNNPGIGSVEFAKNITKWTATSTKAMDYWITAGDTPAEILSNYASVTGYTPMMPDWAMGFWQCKLRYQTQEELLNVAREYKRRNIPLSVIIADFFHWPAQGDWKFDSEYWPDPKAMVDELNEMGTKLMVSIWPTVDPQSENYKEMEEKGFLIRTDRGHRIGLNFQANTIHYDATHPDAQKFVWEKIKQNYYDYGIHAFWLDEAEPEYSHYDFDIYRYHLGPNLQIGNIYPKLYAKGFYDGLRSEGNENVLSLIRCAWAGSQRYGALVWSGDIDSSFEALRNQLVAGLNMAMAGIPWWTTDIGGFHGGDPNDESFRECFIRWFQYGAFCPVMRLHGDRSPQTKPLGTKGGGLYPSGADNEIWSYGEIAYDICKKYIAIRERLRPYVKELMQEASTSGTPPMRPLFFDFPEDKVAWEIENQYMLGPNLLVAPILYEGQRTREIYLPQGINWHDLWTGEIHEGGKKIIVDAPIDRIPIFHTPDFSYGGITNESQNDN